MTYLVALYKESTGDYFNAIKLYELGGVSIRFKQYSRYPSVLTVSALELWALALRNAKTKTMQRIGMASGRFWFRF
jgi:hypothetical protein